ncbi:HD family phosphohydrolase [Robertmurraya andreesenii]|uniref:Nucleotidyltransferase with HDIG domain n=1 Tax=Anoxybacillus andreesenii TaxID=1325932 RepID=A0ABT9V5W1_9BACL|nr:HD family phosphohydrolase [Robertmurraya andreesenii]MDQ0156339.1 putative nucleotidyltransferase with HDIG domain [Robertmurraya andreesenii]
MERFQQQLARIRDLLDVTFFRVLLFILLALILYVAMYSNVKPEKLDLNLFSVASQAIRSPVTIFDKESTERKKEAAEAQVGDVYVLKKEINENRVDLITSIFNSAAEVNKDVEAGSKSSPSGESETPSGSKPTGDKVAMLKEKLTEDVSDDVSDSTFAALVSSSPQELSIAKDTTVTAINNVMKNKIPADEVENAKKRVEEELRFANLDLALKSAVIELGRYAIMQNEFFDVNATQELRKQARESVEPVKILQGEIIVEENQLINPEIYRQLELVGLLDNENSRLPFVGLLLIIGTMLAALYFYFYGLDVKRETKQNYVLLFSIIFILTIGLLKGISLIQINYSEIGYVFPVAMGAMLIKILIDERLALLWTVIMAVCASIIFNEGISSSLNITVGIYILCSGIAGILYLSKQNQRSKILQAGLFVSVINLIVIFALAFMQNVHYNALEYTFYFVAAFVSGISSAVLTIGLLPFFEAGFGFLSTMRLIELSNPNHPLLRKLLTEAPGTYHHSVMVANLSEAACEAIGANGLLARVGCYYHDIGKTNRPQFFIENQMNIENPHDRLPPLTSKNIIIAHATDGAEILRKYKLPKEIVDIAEQHHGTTLLKFFYHKAKENGLDVNEKEFRYPGPKAQTKEIAIIGIADSVEAAVRSMSSPKPEQIEGLVKNIIADRLQDGQLNECDLTLKELETVANTLCETLKGIFHSRIEYPEMTKQKVKQA